MAGLSESERRREFRQRVLRKLDHLHGQYGIDAVVHHDYAPPDGRGYADAVWLARRPLPHLADERDVPLAAFRVLDTAAPGAVDGALVDLDALRPALAWLVVPNEAMGEPAQRRLVERPGRVLLRTEADLDRFLGG